MQDLNVIRLDDGYDLDISNRKEVPDNSLKNSVLISLLSNKRDSQTGIGGYWADEFSIFPNNITGSLIWRLMQNANTRQNRLTMVDEIRASLVWLIDDSIAEDLNIVITRSIGNTAVFQIELTRFSGENEIYKILWDATRSKFDFTES